MNGLELLQRSPEWHAHRCGKVTASRIGDLMATTAKGWSARRARYMEEIVAERLTGQTVIKRVASMDARSDMEPEARIAYEFYTDNAVEEVGFIDHPTITMAGASPDGLVGEDGGLEIKCPDVTTHVEMLKTGTIDGDYLLQCHFGMACSGRQWWDFISYAPLLPEELKAFIKRVPRDNDLIERIEVAVVDFLLEVETSLAQLRRGRAANVI